MSNAQIVTLAVGLVSITTGGDLIWSLIAIVLGIFIGTVFMAAHSSQGPKLGLPQMIQSRAEFGYLGAILVWVFAYIQYAGFNVFNTVLAGQATADGLHVGSPKAWFWLITVVGAAIALFGYALIHRFERYLAYTTILGLAFLTIAAVAKLHLPAGEWDLAHFHVVPFLAQLGVVAGYQISWAIYVSDYSRYLPPDVATRRTFHWTFWGSALGGIWMMGLGAFIAAAVGDSFDTVGSLKSTADRLVSGSGSVLLVIFALGLVSVIALNMYGGALTLISSIDSLRRVRPTFSVRAAAIAVTAVISLVFAYGASAHFLTNFDSFLLIILYLFIPWTAVNLTDYFVVRRGHYAIAEIFKPAGIYRRWGWAGIVSYLVAFFAMVPFFSAAPLLTGFISTKMHGADISLFVGLPIATGLYLLLSRNVDTASESALAAEQAVALDAPQAVSAAPLGSSV